jgi:hemolysin III
MDSNKNVQRDQSTGEEIFNSIVHGVGSLLSVAGLVILVIYSALMRDPWKIVSFSIFGSTLILLYLSSTIYHALTHKIAKAVFLIFDHSAIYLLIAGTYTPFLLVNLRGPMGWTLFGIEWGIAILGIVYKAFNTGKNETLSLIMYLVMGWLIVFVLKPLTVSLGTTGLVFLVTGGVVYSVGILFYVWDRVPFLHAIWHFFVLGGSICHFFSMVFGVLPY